MSDVTIIGDISRLTILSVRNGWIVVQSENSYGVNALASQEERVAETPERLAEIITAWAQRCPAVSGEGGA
jgi:hypothetical protein